MLLCCCHSLPYRTQNNADLMLQSREFTKIAATKCFSRTLTKYGMSQFANNYINIMHKGKISLQFNFKPQTQEKP